MLTIPAQPEHQELQAIALVCDLCHCTIMNLLEDGVTKLEPGLLEVYGNAFAVTIEMKAGDHNLDGGSGETTSFDLCPRCFESRLQPWLESQGAEALVEDWHT